MFIGFFKNYHRCLVLLLASGILSGCATTVKDGSVNTDPIESINRIFYSVDYYLDKYLLKSIAEAYVDAVPQPVRTNVTNFFYNLSYLNVILNSLLQGKFEQGISDTARILLNTTLGIGGLFDVATEMRLPFHEEDFGQTLAIWGFKQGAYLYIPVISGPSSTRNAPDIATNTLLNPLTYATGALLWPVSVLKLINLRANLLDDTSIRDEAALDPYVFTREAYTQRRKYLIHDGNLPAEDYDDIFDEGTVDGTSAHNKIGHYQIKAHSATTPG